jgi:hypothetical protein
MVHPERARSRFGTIGEATETRAIRHDAFEAARRSLFRNFAVNETGGR